MAEKKNVLVVGASRGLGLALAEEYCARDWQVIATCRGSSAGLHTLSKRYPSSLEIETVDIVDLPTVQALRSRLDGRKLDVLFVNAGISKANELTPVQVEEKDYLDMLLTNASGLLARGPERRSRNKCRCRLFSWPCFCWLAGMLLVKN